MVEGVNGESCGGNIEIYLYFLLVDFEQSCCQDLYLGPKIKTKTFTFKSQVKTKTFKPWVSGQDQDFWTRVWGQDQDFGILKVSSKIWFILSHCIFYNFESPNLKIKSKYNIQTQIIYFISI